MTHSDIVFWNVINKEISKDVSKNIIKKNSKQLIKQHNNSKNVLSSIKQPNKSALKTINLKR
jgi:hypothetical protein